MNITYKTDRNDIDWERVSKLLASVHLADYCASDQQKIFEGSYAVAFAYHDSKIIGVGRAISDGLSQAAIYNVAVDEDYRCHGAGSKIIELLLDQLDGQTVTLYTHPRNLDFYENLGFRRDKTSFSIYMGPAENLKFKEKEGFYLPRGFRFPEEV